MEHAPRFELLDTPEEGQPVSESDVVESPELELIKPPILEVVLHPEAEAKQLICQSIELLRGKRSEVLSQLEEFVDRITELLNSPSADELDGRMRAMLSFRLEQIQHKIDNPEAELRAEEAQQVYLDGVQEALDNIQPEKREIG